MNHTAKIGKESVEGMVRISPNARLHAGGWNVGYRFDITSHPPCQFQGEFSLTGRNTSQSSDC